MQVTLRVVASLIEVEEVIEEGAIIMATRMVGETVGPSHHVVKATPSCLLAEPFLPAPSRRALHAFTSGWLSQEDEMAIFEYHHF